MEPGREYVLGRDLDADLPTPWDGRISRRHLRLAIDHGELMVERLPAALNPVCVGGREVERCRIAPGGLFVVGETVFHVVDERPASSPPRPVEEVTFDRQRLRKLRFRDADRRIDVLARLPEVIWGAGSEAERNVRLVNLVLAGVARADAAAIVSLDERGAARLVHWERRRETAGAFRPSDRLVADALRRQRRSVLHVWEGGERPSDYTASAEFDWAFCTPVGQAPADEWGLYVAGRLEEIETLESTAGREVALEPDVKFTELVAEIISAVARVNTLERRQSAFRQFFAPPVLAALGDDIDSDLLEPRECDLTVLFCDLRGFSAHAEESAGDLIGLLERVSRALEVMTENIRRHRGVTGDFQGDAALGFWGWPFSSEEAPLDACRAALGIRRAFAEFARIRNHPLADFRAGIGIAHGRSVAGKIGTRDQVKVTVFGPVANLASRLESATRQLGVSILLDEATAKIARERLDKSEGRVRRLARVIPWGLETPLTVCELLPPEDEFPELSDEHLALYEEAVEHFIAGRWDEAYRRLHVLPPSDHAQDFLGMQILRHQRVAPPDWTGAVRLPGK
ncbi:MAG: adenylate/guanylate cyclase domain-containing protein [Planctomycetes bacterium]|nr:adenylate/guanylate cyclase domain-containing protein [Planctomycetota bacterium]